MFGEELRRRALYLVLEEKKKRGDVANALGMTRRTLYTWIEVYKKEGRTAPITTRTGPGQRRKLDPTEFKKFIDQNTGMSIQQMTVVLGVGKSAVGTALRAIDYTRKKNNIYTRSEKKKQEQNSQ